MAVAWNLRQLRKRARLTGRELADLLAQRCPGQAVGITMLGEIERGRRRLSLELALALARTLCVDVRLLFAVPADHSPASIQLSAGALSPTAAETAEPADAA